MIELKNDMPILLVSENPDTRHAIEKLFQPLGLRNIVSMPDAMAALNYACHAKIEVLITDMQAGTMNGWQLIKEFKVNEKIANASALLFGKEDCSVPDNELKEYGVLGFLKYPFDSKALMRTLVNSYSETYIAEDSTEHKFTEAKEALISQDTEKAISLFEDLRAETSKSSRSAVGLVQSYTQNEQSAEAQKFVGEIKDNSLLSVQITRLKLHLTQQQLEEAQGVLTELLKRALNAEQLYLDALQTCKTYKCHRLVIQICENAFVNKIPNPEFAFSMISALIEENETDEAMKLMSKVENKLGSLEVIYNLKGRVYRKLFDYQKAFEIYKEATGLWPKKARNYYNAALCLIAQANIEGAKEWLERSIKIDPSFTFAKIKLDELKKGILTHSNAA